MKYKKHPKYKDSGVEWIGEIPENWEVRSVRYLLNAGKSGIRIGPFGSSLKLEMMKDSGFKIYGQENVIDDDFSKGHRFIDEEKFLEMKNYEIFPNDIVITMMGTTGKSKTVPDNIQQGIMDSHLVRMRTNQNICHPKLFSLILNDASYVQSQLTKLSNGSIMQGLNSQIIKSVKIILPPIDDQEKTFDFIQHKKTQFDELITKSKKQITILEEKRQATINQAVTKGLDPSVPMKDSGVEWIGQIPEEWEIKPLFSVCKDNKKKNTENKINNVLSLSYGKIKKRNIESNFGLLPASFQTYQIVDIGDIVLRLTDLQNDKRSLRVGLVNEKGIITSAYTGLKVDNSVDSSFLYNLLHFYDIEKIFYGLGSGVRQSMNFSDLKKLPIVIPPKIDSEQISEFLDKKTTQFDELIAKSKQQIAILEEKRQALITAAVTGKIDVRSEAIA